MTNILRKTLALLLVAVMLVGTLPGMSVFAATVNYQYGSTDDYANVIKNWGTRGELATFLSPNAEAFYEDQGVSYAQLSAQAGSSNVDQVADSELYQALYELMSGAHSTKNTYGDTRYLCQFTDIEKNGSESAQISTFYSGTMVGPDWDGGATWSREHTWPDSKGGSADTNNDTKTNESDIMMVRPVPQSENSSRGNKAYGVSSGYYFPNLTETYDVRGDVARTVLYVYVRWGRQQSAVMENLWGSDGVMESLAVLLDWIEADPVDTWEMGRNDSVESITGTRNVFVDYPELAFDLFETELPEMDTPSGNAGAAGYTITALSNNNAYGTVSVNGSNVTAYPASGYQVAGYQVTSGSAEVTVNGNVFTVAATSDCTILITFEKIPSHTVQFVENGVQANSVAAQTGQSITLPAYAGTVPEGYTFGGWVTDEILSATAEKPASIYQPGASYSVSDNIAFYSLLWFVNSEDQSNLQLNYELVDSAEDLKIGSSYIIAAADYDFAMGTVNTNGNNRLQAAVTKDGTALHFDIGGGVSELTLHEGMEITVTEPSEGGECVYEKVTAAPEDWSGEYLIVYEGGSVAFDGSRTSLDASGNTQSVTIESNKITADQKYQFTIAAVSGGYSVQSASGYYIGQASNANGLATSTTSAAVNTISINADGTVNIVSAGGAYLRYNSASNQLRFRYYKSSTYSGQKAITLYKKTGSSAQAADSAQTVAGSTTVTTYAFYDAANGGYLYAAASATGSNLLKLQTTLNENGSFAITVNADGSCDIIAQGSNTNNTLRYNASSGLFSCYGSTGTTKPVALYVGVPGAGTVYYATVAETTECTHADKTTVEFEPSCSAQGYTEYYCADCGEYLYTDEYVDALGHTEVVTPGYAATLTAAGLSDGVHCSVCNEVLVIQEAIPCLASVDSWGLVLADDLSVKFKIYVDASISTGAKIHISLNSFTTTYETAALTALGENYYYASVNVAAAQMGDTISVHITNGNDSSETKTYSVLEYATKMLADADQSKYHALLKEMLNYGAAAQTYFGYKTGSLVNAEITGAGMAAVPAAAPQNMTFTGSAEGISYYGASLVYREKLAVRFYFEGSVDGITFACAGEPCTAASKNGMYYVEVGGILPQNLDQSITLTATDAAGNTFTVTYSPMNYIVRMYNKGNDTQKNLMTALYNYHLAAKALIQA